MTDKKQYLFLFSIGPVQSFIAQARKTQDLYAGSRILSELIKAGIKEVQKEHTIIFPFTNEFEKVESLPNRFVALIENEPNLRGFGKTVENSVCQKWNEIAQKVFNEVIQKNIQARQSTLIDFNGINQQIEQHLEINWLFEELTENYSESFKNIERNFGAIKNVRSFQQFDYNGLGETGRKCSVDGFRNVKFYRKSLNQEKWDDLKLENTFLFANDNFKFNYQDTNPPLSVIQPGEGLSAVSFVKRCYKIEGKGINEFESTAEIALLKTIAFLKSKNQDLKGFEDNPQLLYRDNLNLNYFNIQGLRESDLPKFEEKLKAFEQLAKDETPNIKFQKYYAILAFDGDSMGEWLSKATTWKEHQDFSKLLIDFAQKAKTYLDNGKGRSVYAGGDDFLGFVNLEYLFEVLIWMRDNFKIEVADKIPFRNGDKTLTFSAGVCIAHYKEPLSIILNRARQMEHKAKDWRTEKNTFGIAVIKGSGEEHETIWGLENESLENISFLIDEMRREHISNTFLKNFQREWERTLDSEGNFKLFSKMLKIEFERLLVRSLNSKISKEDKKILKDEVVKGIWEDLFDVQDSKLSNFFTLLNICDFLQRNMDSLPSKQNQHAELAH